MLRTALLRNYLGGRTITSRAVAPAALHATHNAQLHDAAHAKIPTHISLFQTTPQRQNKRLLHTARSKRPQELRKPHQQSNRRRDDAHVTRHLPAVPQTNSDHVQAWVSSWALETPAERLDIVRLRSDVWTLPPREDIVHRVVHWTLQSARPRHRPMGKTRGEVRGGGRKPRPQKGTGRSRQGSIRAPHYRGGGVPHPRRARDHSYALNEKVIKLGTRVCLSDKYRRGALLLVDAARLDETSPEHLLEKLAALGIQGKRGHRAMIVCSDDPLDEGAARLRASSEKLTVYGRPWVSARMAKDVRVLDLLRHEILVVGLDALHMLEGRFPVPPPPPTPPAKIELPVVPLYMEPPNVRAALKAQQQSGDGGEATS